mgnify:CR=1 FL=1
MLTIHGRRNSSNVQKVVWALNEMGVSYERLDVGGEFGICLLYTSDAADD